MIEFWFCRSNDVHMLDDGKPCRFSTLEEAEAFRDRFYKKFAEEYKSGKYRIEVVEVHEKDRSMTELQWTAGIAEYLRCELGCIVKVEHAASVFQASGWPDRWICHPVWCGWIEFKGEKTAVTRLQKERMRQIWKRQPGSVFVVRKGADGCANTT